MSAPTNKQIELLQHALGVNEDRREPYRNYFLAGGSNVARWDEMVAAGWAKRGRTPSFVPQEEVNFHVTDAGRALAIAALPEPPKRTRYSDWIDRDGSEDFPEFLLGEKAPRWETKEEFIRQPGQWLGKRVRLWRMYRTDGDWYSHRAEVQGDWFPTKKDAKASYKAALKALHEKQRVALRSAA